MITLGQGGLVKAERVVPPDVQNQSCSDGPAWGLQKASNLMEGKAGWKRNLL